MSLSERRLTAIVDGEWWREQAACKGTDADVFFTYRTKPEALKLCVTCPVNNCCLDYALKYEAECGIWGGFTPRQRSRYRRELTHYASTQLRQGRWGTIPELGSGDAFDEAENSSDASDDSGLG